ncbi:MAG TPA: UDP-glucose 4-epimerase GalE [Clostridiales bacterium]|nr:UDP-glucose 4-epimerase GalE [Clostridiales bacterium]
MSLILVTGGAGYIGSHTCVELLNEGHELVIVDNLANSRLEAINRIRAITGRDFAFYRTDVCDRAAMTDVFARHPIEAVIHFAGLKAVGESVAKPLEYYRNNLDSTLTLCEVCREAGVRKIVFSSSATVYGVPGRVPITEDMPLFCTNPYGWTKFMNEQILRDLAAASPDWSIMLLRYFNPIGAHASGLIGEDPAGIPNNLMPYIAQVAVNRLPSLHIYGNDYPTPDGTGVRDYIHVVDLAAGHCRAIDYTFSHTGVEMVNLGTGRGYSVLEMVAAFEKASGRQISYQIDPRRPGDIAASYADPSKAAALLNWRAERSLDEMCADTWRWQSKNPNRYQA